MPLSTNRVLKISASSTKVPGAKLSMIVGTLRRTNDVFAGDFQLKVVPFFFKSERGIVSIEIDDKAIARAAAGEIVELKGVAKADGPGRPVTATATPIDAEHGALIIVIQEDEKRFRFSTDYRFELE